MTAKTVLARAKPGKWSVFEEYLQSLLWSAVLAGLIMIFLGGSVRVDGSSMEPGFHNGERVIVDKVSYRFREPQRGDVIVLRWPAGDPRPPYIKRVIGRPGDTVLLSGGRVVLNGRSLAEGYAAEPIRGEFGPFVVPPGSYFVLGDNRNYSEDSRFTAVGYIPAGLVAGRAVARYWPLTRLSLIFAGR
jgi:signal peptidase I